MIYIALIIVVAAVLFYQKLIRDGKIPRQDSPKGLPTRIAGLVLFVAAFTIYISLAMQGSYGQSNIVTTLVILAAGATMLMRAKQRQGKRRAEVGYKGEMKQSFILLSIAITFVIILAIIYPYVHK